MRTSASRSSSDGGFGVGAATPRPRFRLGDSHSADTSAQRDDERARRVLLVATDHAATFQDEEQSDHGLAHDGDAALALIAATGHDQHLARALDLLLAQPRLRSRGRGSRGGQRVAKIQRALRAKSDFVERLSQSLQSFLSLWAPHALNLRREQRLRGRPGLDAQILGEANLVAREPTRAQPRQSRRIFSG